jgi:hypothetical protein
MSVALNKGALIEFGETADSLEEVFGIGKVKWSIKTNDSTAVHFSSLKNGKVVIGDDFGHRSFSVHLGIFLNFYKK